MPAEILFNDSVISFLRNEMCIDIDDVIEKLSSEPLREHKADLVLAIEKFYYLLSHENPEDAINNHYCMLEHLHGHDDTRQVLDSFRHAFISFASNGLLQLFTRQENEVWYPKVILERELKPNDIQSLPSTITLYRGTDYKEYESNNFGQSWTTNKEIAAMFAFQHYQGQEWFNENERVILTATLSRDFVYYSNQTCEFEVVINTEKLENVQMCMQNYL